MGVEQIRNMNTRRGAGDNHFGVKTGDIRILAKEIKSDPDLAQELWNTGNLEARLLALLILKPKALTRDQVENMVRDINFGQLAEWMSTHVLKVHPDREAMRQSWMESDHPWLSRAGWGLTADRIPKDESGLDLNALLDRIEKEMATASEAAQWTMNFTLGNIGIHHPELRERALAIGEQIGLYKDWPVSKGCTIPYVPVWVNEMVSRQEAAV